MTVNFKVITAHFDIENQFLTLFKILIPKLLHDSFHIVDKFALFISLCILQWSSYYFLYIGVAKTASDVIIIIIYTDSHEEFPSVPKVPPSLGLKAGHDRRDIAAARKSRPPTRKATAAEQQVRLELLCVCVCVCVTLHVIVCCVRGGLSSLEHVSAS